MSVLLRVWRRVACAATLLLAAVAGGHYAYYAWPAGWERSWAQWVGLNVLVIVLALLLLPLAKRLRTRPKLAAAACWLAVIESGQAAGCSVWAWGSVPQADLCVETFGLWPYVAASAVFAAIYINGRRQA